MVKPLAALSVLAAIIPSGVLACGGDGSHGDSCYGPIDKVEHVRHVKRIQPGAPEASIGPKGPLEWGQLNFIHTASTQWWERKGGRG